MSDDEVVRPVMAVLERSVSPLHLGAVTSCAEQSDARAASSSRLPRGIRKKAENQDSGKTMYVAFVGQPDGRWMSQICSPSHASFAPKWIQTSLGSAGKFLGQFGSHRQFAKSDWSDLDAEYLLGFGVMQA